mmetsp:Transcript_138225/g.441684  ORF Transcript_138225/g.441684 Transcript_138225/m.441684 type:complete len:368 (-) Transcript_138225:40-1143(-)|eukprot:CAMPEP_0203930686 /NCGR_PEP_ID=MMETSP0359-20131031/69375_1 /ASSEMBLY_ACC=CAM_ASM_000338 /TAXON_ID=268821 /ORGANISM="Scrippsiella Hangoei, Strain SHTV-5" /LENGTH=367 /DNA_ID=CAMNT_0050859893 /DNA_START=82 /DNA_END=1185 /DNA_ORIENTATION=-
MGKKGKKKSKETGTPDVQKFKKTREFWLLKECVTIQESLPFVAMDVLDDLAFMKVARFLNMVGLLAEHLQVNTKKDYRFNYHHKYLAPTPQFFPFGYDVDVIRQARLVQEKPGITYNDQEYQFAESLRTLSEKFLKEIDSYMTKIASEIEPRLKDDFATGLKRFKVDLKEDLEIFDQMWIKYEQEYVKARHEILTQVFQQVDRLVTLEMMLTQAEERLDVEAKQALENELVREIEKFTRYLCPDLPHEDFPEDVIPLAEACIFYESKCTEEWLHLAKYLIKDYLELRIYISKIPEERLKPQLKENQQLMRILRSFHESVLASRVALDFVSRLPRLIHAKTSNWMTKKLLEPDLRYIQKTAHLALEST